ncbi:hypothetical protein H257_13113 [Aphanomyces astaci]|uniref:RNase NYN domain-containing protein n=1 Tax=Aphanomyces astaci TaxID=112090 RepID=W4FVX3_APHAT|nr:hypothetical protein H257_13113 [Aphanomyces astaci]ETV71675.1 hypothetical protein H257_13113 [Aphanomyces astaci]|eukprot:XP_009838863.1 hypothetical protein H257_13113 [Aphanomyces astaci]
MAHSPTHHCILWMTTSQSLVVLDAANVATVVRGAVRIQRLQHAIDHFESLGIRCIAFAPGYWVKSKTLTPRSRSQQSAEMELDQKAEMAAVQELVLLEKVVLTPPQAHDDLFIIDYAIKHDGFVVTNDMFRDHVANKMQFHGKELTETWVKRHCITFAFVGTEFLPSAQHMQALLRQKQPPSKAVKASSSRSSSPRPNSFGAGSNNDEVCSAKKPPGASKASPSNRSRSNSPRVKPTTSWKDDTFSKGGSEARLVAAATSPLTIITTSLEQQQQQHCVDDLSFEEEVRASLTPGVVEPKQPRRAKTPSKSRASTPRNNSESNNMYRSLDEASTSSDDDKVPDQGKTHAATPDEEPHEPARPKNVQEGWNLLQSIIARSNPPSSIPTAASNNNQEETQGSFPTKEDHPKQLEDETKALSPSQKKRGRRRAKKQAAAAMVYRGKLWAMIAIPLVGGLVLKSLVSANPHP